MYLESECFGHRQGLTDAGALDDTVVVQLGGGQVRQTLEQILPERATYAAVGQLDHPFGLLFESPRCLDEIGVNVDLGHVINNQGYSEALLKEERCSHVKFNSEGPYSIKVWVAGSKLMI